MKLSLPDVAEPDLYVSHFWPASLQPTTDVERTDGDGSDRSSLACCCSPFTSLVRLATRKPAHRAITPGKEFA